MNIHRIMCHVNSAMSPIVVIPSTTAEPQSLTQRNSGGRLDMEAADSDNGLGLSGAGARSDNQTRLIVSVSVTGRIRESLPATCASGVRVTEEGKRDVSPRVISAERNTTLLSELQSGIVQPQAFHLLVERGAVDVERFGRGRSIPAVGT